jgi:peroxiredoxin
MNKAVINFLYFFFGIISINSPAQIPSTPGVNTGEKAPRIRGMDQYGNRIDSYELIKEGPFILLFYRGNWCPYCRKHLGNLQDSLQWVIEKGASVLVVTPETPESIDKMVGKTLATFSIIHDEKYKIMNDYGVSFKISELTVPRYLDGVLNKTRKANQNDDDILPVPATFLVDTDHRIRYLHYDPDYRVRLSVSEILKHL